MKLFVLLLFAHLIGDFVLQTEQMVVLKRQKFKGLLLHSFIIFVATFLVLLPFQVILLAFIVSTSHLFIDYSKIKWSKRRCGFNFFIIDQILHVIILIVLSLLISDEISFLLSLTFALPLLQIIAVLNGLLLNTIVAGWIIAIFFQSTYPDEDFKSGLKDAGKYIGYLERLIIMLMVLSNNIAGIGFLITAKSILRIGKLTDNENKKEAEYIILGTFLSIVLALLWNSVNYLINSI